MTTRIRAVTGPTCAALAVVLASCGLGQVLEAVDDRIEGSGDVVTETRDVGEYDRVELAGEGRVRFGAVADDQIEIETDDNLLDHIEIEVSGGTLRIRTAAGVDIDPTSSVTYRLGCPALTGVELTGAGTVELDPACVTDDRLELELSGAGSIEATELAVEELVLSLPGAGDVEVDGTADRLDVELSGAASVDAADLEVAVATVDSSGVGVATVWVTETLEAELSGVGSIRYFGEPSVTESVDGVGRIEALGPKER